MMHLFHVYAYTRENKVIVLQCLSVYESLFNLMRTIFPEENTDVNEEIPALKNC